MFPSDARAQINQNSRIVVGKGIFVQTCSFGGCKTHINAIIGQLNGVKSRLYTFETMVERSIQVVSICIAGVSVTLVKLCLLGVVGHEKHVAQVATSGTGEVSVRKANHQCIAVMIT